MGPFRVPPSLLCACALALGACRSSTFGHVDVASAAAVPAVVERALAEEQAGRPTEAIDLLYAAREVDELSTDERIRVETLLEQMAERRIRQLEELGSGDEELEDLTELGLPTPTSVRAGVAAARQRQDRGSSYKAYKLLADLETRFPTHSESKAASEITTEAGLAMTLEPRRFLGFFTRRDEGIEALEWLVLTYPSQQRCDEAYFRLGEIYAADRRYKLAVQRYEDLVSYHLGSALSIEAQARVPRMRLTGLESPEYDRAELIKARRELELWLENHPGRAQEEQVRRDYGDCLRRLVLSDQGIARFYLRIGRPFGAQLHAQRALDVARLTGDAELVTACETLLVRANELADRVAREGEFEGFLDRPDAEELPPEAIQPPPPGAEGVEEQSQP
jgi:tetratricopeptide (TPR) repeat protein